MFQKAKSSVGNFFKTSMLASPQGSKNVSSTMLIKQKSSAEISPQALIRDSNAKKNHEHPKERAKAELNDYIMKYVA
jgi:hypothetical protein